MRVRLALFIAATAAAGCQLLVGIDDRTVAPVDVDAGAVMDATDAGETSVPEDTGTPTTDTEKEDTTTADTSTPGDSATSDATDAPLPVTDLGASE